MLGLKLFRGFGRKIHIKRNQALLINRASKIALKSGFVDGEVGMGTSISGSISHVTKAKGEY